MKGKLALALLAILGLILTGCASDRLMRLETQTKTLQGRLDGMNDQMTSLGEQVRKVQDSMAEEQSRAQGIDKKLDDIASRIADLEEEAEEPEDIGAEAEEPVSKPVAEAVKPAPQEEVKPDVKPAKASAAKIKVLSGTGSLPAAVQMARKIESLGYKVDRVDYAPRANFIEHTVYYASTARDAAETLVRKLSCGAVSKPLTWHSTFDIIVVTGK